ncbi:hypothetical protein HGM15179_004662, partial [Zosterops borbonicus]
ICTFPPHGHISPLSFLRPKMTRQELSEVPTEALDCSCCGTPTAKTSWSLSL